MKNIFFDCHRLFLPLEHSFRKQRDKFYKGTVEKDITRQRLTSIMSLLHIESGRANERKEMEGFGCSYNWVKNNIFWELRYWDTNLRRHTLDVMHIERMYSTIYSTQLCI